MAAEKIKKNNEEEQLSFEQSVLLYLHDMIYLLAIVMVVFVLLFRIVVVSGSSMYSTLWNGDWLLVTGSAFYREPQVGDIIVASKDSFNSGEPIIKRVIATENQTVDIDFERGVVIVDGVELHESYTYTPTNVEEGVIFPITIAENCVFVMGDNRNGSKDSRHPEIGLVDKREVLGKVFFLFLPGTNGTDIHGNPKEPKDFGRIGVIG